MAKSIDASKIVIGVLALQGDVSEHVRMIESLGAQTREVRRVSQLDGVDGLIIPGGESTTIAKLTGQEALDDIMDAIQKRALAGMPIYGTCMGSIFLAKEIEGSSQGRLALMDIKVRRNAFGPQRFSAEHLIEIPALGVGSFNAVFIRAPIIVAVGIDVDVMASIPQGIVMAKQKNMLVTSFHPELTDNNAVHQYFLQMVVKSLTPETFTPFEAALALASV